MQKKTNLLRIAAAVFAGFFLGGIVFLAPSHTEARAADDLFDELMGDNASVMVVPMQLGRESYGLAMVDSRSQTLWIYEITSRKAGFNQLRLMAARSWEYDRQLKDFNSGEPSAQTIKNFLEGAGLPQPGAAPLSPPVEIP